MSQTGQSKFSSITGEGSKKYDALAAIADWGRGPMNRANRREIELKTLNEVRVNAGIVGDSLGAHRKRKRAKPKHIPTQSDMGHDDFGEDKVVDDGDFVVDFANLAQAYPQVTEAAAHARTQDLADDDDELEN